MPFFNKYKKTEEHSYISIIRSDNFYYAVGSIIDGNSKNGLILKISKKGKVLWENKYKISGIENLEFRKAILCDNKDIVVFSNIDYKLVVFRIDPSGIVIWSKEYSLPDSNQSYYLGALVKFGTGQLTGGVENFIINFVQDTGKGHILKIDGNGTILAQKKINSTISGNGGYELITNNDSICLLFFGSILVFDINLNLLDHFKIDPSSIVPGPNNSFSPFYINYYDNDTLLMYGTTTTFGNVDGTNMFLKVSLTNPVSSFTGRITFLAGLATGFISKSNIIFFYSLDGIYKYDIDLGQILWVKDINDNVYFTELSEEEIIFTNGSRQEIGALNLDFDSCKTSNSTGTDLPPLTGNRITLGIVPIEAGAAVTTNYFPTATSILPILEEICVFPGNEIIKVDITDNTMLQSPNFYLQGAGSTGDDSTKGIHLRWALKKGLANHLPKANYATPNINFNKVNDYVKIYRAPYDLVKTTLNLSTAPSKFNDTKGVWTYAVGSRIFYLNFLNIAVYTQVRQSINPTQNPKSFLSSYFQNSGILEIENKNELSYAITPYFNNTTTALVSTELLSVEENKITAPKSATLRKKYTYSAVNSKKLLSENIRSIRLKCTGTYPIKIEFEFYSDFIDEINNNDGWVELGQHALTLDDVLAYQRLEPQENIVNGKWLRYNHNAFVKTDNYKNRWNGQDIDPDERVKNCVQKYIELSNDITNPMAIETFSYPPVDGQPEDEETDFEISNLQLLNIASLDYHIARMLGLGILDINEEIFTGQHVYLAEYITFGNLQDGLGAREVKHVYCSLPTSLTDSRLPVPINLKEPVPGIFQNNMIESQGSITDTNGYSHDGKTRFISLFHEDLPDEQENAPFFYKNYEFISATNTIPVYAGIEYKKTGDILWRKPELSFNSLYSNIDITVIDDFQKKETISIMIPENGYALYIHREKQSGWHDYSSYGINWFSRAAASTVIQEIETVITPANSLLPPTNVNAVLIQKESPLFLTSAVEQQMLNSLEENNLDDKTLIRLTFEYDYAQDQIDYHKEINGQVINGYSELPDNEELFAENIEIFFRNRVPDNVSGKISKVTNLDADPRIALIETAPYELISTGQEDPAVPNQWIIPSLGNYSQNFTGSIIVIDEKEYIITSVTNNQYPLFKILKRNSDGMITDLNQPMPDQLIGPKEGEMFIVVENMQLGTSWKLNTKNPSLFKVNIDHTTVYHENIININTDNIPETHIEKFRGIYQNSTISKVYEDVEVYTQGNEEPAIVSRHLGLYEITFPGYSLSQHSQFAMGVNSVEFYNGTVRIHTLSSPNDKRKILKVVRTKNIGISGAPLIIYASDMAFPTDEDGYTGYDGKIIPDNFDSITQKVNYYPGYKVYLYKNITQGLIEDEILPAEGEDIRYSIFSLRSYDTGYNFWSRLSIPTLMFAKVVKEPKIPNKPTGGLFATRPDFFGKASYTFLTGFKQKPYSVQFGRASDIQIISSVYNASNNYSGGLSTIDYIMDNIFKDGQEKFYVDRWENFLSLKYDNGEFAKFPEESGIRLPMPDSPIFISAINSFINKHNVYYPNDHIEHIEVITKLSQVVIPQTGEHGELLISDFLRDVISNCFIPLTEIPVLFDYVKRDNYTPIPKKQVIRDRNGNLLSPSDTDFDMAPMMKISEITPIVTTQFTDFGLDGASKARYFYAAKEINLQMQASAYSEILGPISMVNTSPPTSPDIIKSTSILENRTLNVEPGIEFQINSYPSVQDIRKINLYRTTDRSSSLSIRTMDLVKVIDLENENMLESDIWIFKDSFSDLAFVPYGDLLYYRITVSRRIKYNNSNGDLIIDYAPSESSKLIITNITNNYTPDSPIPWFTSEPFEEEFLTSVVLHWEQTVYNGKYHVYKLNSQGSWIKISEIVTNESTIDSPIGDLDMTNEDGVYIRHHFKVLAENFSGIISTKENILTIYINPEGIAFMIIEDTFIVE